MDHKPVRRAMLSSKNVVLMIPEQATAFRLRRLFACQGILPGRPGDVLLHHRIIDRGSLGVVLAERSNRLLVATITNRHGKVAPETRELRTSHRTSLHQRAKIAIGASP